MSTVNELDKELNEMILSGKAMEAFEKFYSEDIVMQENDDDPFIGKKTNRKREEEFFAGIEEVHEFSLTASATEGNVSMSEWVFDATFKGGARSKWTQASVRRWTDGQVASERFFHATMG